jgi:molybdenum cofactor cytidylyltransferase
MIASVLPRLQVVVLAAGFSARLGTPKALARIHGTNLLNRTLRVLAPFATASKIIVIVPPRSSRYRIGQHAKSVEFVANPWRACGLSSSVRLGVAKSRSCAAVLLIAVDLARLERREVARLISRWRGARRSVVARRVGDRVGMPVILPRSLFSLALELEGDQGLRELLQRLPKQSVVPVSMPSAKWDVDTVRDLASARRRFRPLQD